MSEVKTEPVTAQLVTEGSLLDGPAGAIKFYTVADHDGPAGFNFRCPCGCDAVRGVSVRPGGWTWNGSREKPTVRPSVVLSTHDGLHWHGYLTDGVWRSSC